MIRSATAEDRSAVEAIVAAAYSIYLQRMEKPPGPMLDDYGALIRKGAVTVMEGNDGSLDGLIVLLRSRTICCSTISRCGPSCRATGLAAR